MKAISISADGSVKGKNEGAETDLEIVALKESAQKVGNYALEIGKTDILSNPQTFYLMEHRRVCRVGVDPINTPRRNDANFRHRVLSSIFSHVRLHIAHLDRACMCTQQNGLRRLCRSHPADKKYHALNAPGDPRGYSML